MLPLPSVMVVNVGRVTGIPGGFSKGAGDADEIVVGVGSRRPSMMFGNCDLIGFSALHLVARSRQGAAEQYKGLLPDPYQPDYVLSFSPSRTFETCLVNTRVEIDRPAAVEVNRLKCSGPHPSTILDRKKPAPGAVDADWLDTTGDSEQLPHAAGTGRELFDVRSNRPVPGPIFCLKKNG